MEKPLQFFALTLLESVKMFFWESTQIGFVEYAPWQTKLYAYTPFKNALRLIMSIVSIAAFLGVITIMLKNKTSLINFVSTNKNHTPIMFFTLLIASCHIIMYSLFMTIPRFILPIAPLYLVIITFWINYFCPHSSSRNLEISSQQATKT